MLLIETAVAIVVLTNLWALADKYYGKKQAEARGLDYACVAAYDVRIDIGELDNKESEPEAKRQLEDFLTELGGLGGNVSVYPVAGDVGDGSRVLYTVYLSADEELPVPTEGRAKPFHSNSGVYVGNYNVNYINDGVLSALADRLEVIGIMASYGFEKNEFVYVKYADLSEVSRKEVVEYIFGNCYPYSYSNYEKDPFTVRAESDLINGEEYRQRFESIIGKYPFLRYGDGDTGAVTPIESAMVIYSGIKYVFLGLSVFMCVGLLFQTMQLFLYSERDNILIKKTYGMREGQIFLPLCAQITAIFGGAVVLAVIAEIIIYRFMAHYNTGFILKGIAVAAAGSIVLEFFALSVAYLKFRLTGMSLASRLSGVEE